MDEQRIRSCISAFWHSADVLNHLLHQVLQRLSDTGLYGNDYGLSEMMADLTASIFSADADPRLASFRQPLQVAYVERLLKVIGPKKNPLTGMPGPLPTLRSKD